MRLGLCSKIKDVVNPLLDLNGTLFVHKSQKNDGSCQNKRNPKLFNRRRDKLNFKMDCGLRDWCISRQLWVEYRIPAYIVFKKGWKQADSLSNKEDNWIAAGSAE